DSRKRIDDDPDQAARLLEQVAIGMGKEEDGLLGVIDGLRGEIGLIVGDQLRTVVPNSMPGIVRSSTYLACPVTFRRPSLRGRDRPMADIRRGLCHGPRHFTSDSLQSRLRHARG